MNFVLFYPKVLSATLAKSGPLDFPSKKSFPLFFCPWKGFRTHISKIVWLFSNSLFFASPQAKSDFWLDPCVDSDRKCHFHNFCRGCCDCNNVAHGILSCYKLQDIFSQFTDKIWKLHLKSYSYQRDQKRTFPSTLICIWKIHQFIGNNSRNAGVNQAQKAYQWIVYTPMRSRLASNPRVSL